MDGFPEGFNLEALLAPIDGEARAGIDLRRDPSPRSLYYRLRDARGEARQIERDKEKPADPLADESQRSERSAPPSLTQLWRTVRELATEALGQAKDLEVAAWLTESLSRDFGLPGLTAGAKLMTGLVENFWDELYPLPDEEGIETRVAPIAGLNGSGSGNGTLIVPLRNLTLFVRPPPDGTAVEFWRYEQSQRLAEAANDAKRQERIAAGAIPLETLFREAMTVGGAHFAKLREAAVGAGDAWRLLGDAIDARAGADAPAMSAVRDLLEKVAEAARFLANEAAPAGAATPVGDAIAADAQGATSGSAPTPAVAIAAREDALRALLDIAEYFRRAEPLSPLAYTLQEAVRRGRMSWPQLLEEIVADPGTRAAILTSLGIRPPSE